MKRKTPFSLIELIVVFAILALLVSLLQPSLKSILSSSDNLLCQSQLKQFGTATRLYTSDYDDYLPISHKMTSDPAWPRELADYLPLISDIDPNLQLIGTIFECPSHDFVEKNLDPKYGGYAFNHQYLGWTDVPRLTANSPQFQWQKAHTIEKPAETIFLGDGINYVELNASRSHPYYLKYLYKPSLASQFNFHYGRHQGMTNMLWSDSSVKLKDWGLFQLNNSGDPDYFFKKIK